MMKDCIDFPERRRTVKKLSFLLALIIFISVLAGCERVDGGAVSESETDPVTEAMTQDNSETTGEESNTVNDSAEESSCLDTSKMTETEDTISSESNDTESQSETDATTDHTTNVETESMEIETVSESDSATLTETDTDNVTETLTQAATQATETETQSETVTETGSVKETETESDSETESESKTETETECPHVFGDWTVETPATCTDTGKEIRSCNCGETEWREIEMLDHTYGEWSLVGEPGCEDERVFIRKCECDAEQQKTESPIGHNESITPAKLPTATEQGYTEKISCTRCGNTLKESKSVPRITVSEATMLSDVTYISTTDGLVTFMWKTNDEYANDLLGMKISATNGNSTWKYEAFDYESTWNFRATGNLVRFTFTFTPISLDGVQGTPVQRTFIWFPDTYTAEFPRIEVITKNGELPTFTKTSPPAGAWGGGITDANYVQSIVSLYNEDNNLLYTSMSSGFDGAKMKVRGNTSAYGAKQPFKIKLAKKFDLLGGLIDRDPTKDYRNKDWVLLKGGSLTNVAVGSAISELVGNEWTPQYCYVTLFVNGEFRGLYILIECIDQDEMRCNVSDSGYIVEFDAYWWNEPLYFTTPITQKYPAKLTFKYPDSDELTLEDERVTYIQQYLSSLENVMLGNAEGDLNDYLDIRSCAKWTLTHDILASWDSGGSNMYMLKYDNTIDSKMRMGPVWDYDSIYWSQERYKYDVFARIREGNHFYIRYLTTNSDFIRIYREEYDAVRNEIIPAVATVFDKYDNDTYRLLLARDKGRWGTGYDDPAAQKTIVLEWFENHLSWMDVNVPFPTE